MEKEIIEAWLNDCETFAIVEKNNGICIVVVVHKGARCREDVDIYHGRTWKKVFEDYFKDAIESYYDCPFELDTSYYFTDEQVNYMKNRYDMFKGW